MFPDYFQGEGVGTVVWVSEDILGGRLHCREVFNATNDERIAWSFAVLRDGFLKVEELLSSPRIGGRQGDLLSRCATDKW